MNRTHQPHEASQQGNVLFLILIAVVLFAALSYAITQSNRGSGNATRETTNVAASSIMQYTMLVRVGMDRMLLGGKTIDDLSFVLPSEAGFNTAPKNEVFNPNGGGVPAPLYSPEQVESNGTTTGYWFFPKKKVIKDVGSAQPETVAILTNVKRALCEQINFHNTNTTTIPDANDTTANLTGDDNGVAFEGTGIDGEIYGCVRTTDAAPSQYLYYHAVVER